MKWRLGLAAALVIALVASIASPAAACGCDNKPLSAIVAQADTIFSVRSPPQINGDAASPFTVEVERVYKGQVGPTAEVWPTEGPLACGIDPTESGPVGLIASDSDGKTTIGTCRPQYTLADIEEILGPGSPPGPIVSMTSPSSTVWTLGSGMLLAGIAGALVLIRRRRNHSDEA